MTVSHNVPALRAPSLMSALGALRGRGMRVSSARRHVLEALYAAERPLTRIFLIAHLARKVLNSHA